MGLSVVCLIWTIAIHSIVHSVAALIFTTTSLYCNYKYELNLTLVSCNCILLFTGVITIAVVFCRRPLFAALLGFFIFILGIALVSSNVSYFLRYKYFCANCLIDIIFFHSEAECWVGPDRKFTFWHLIQVALTIISVCWIVYGFLLWKYARCVCTIPCPPPEQPKPVSPCCPQERWYHRMAARMSKRPCGAPEPCPPPCPATCPPCPPPPCPPPPCPPPPCPPPCTPCKKNPKFVLTLKPN